MESFAELIEGSSEVAFVIDGTQRVLAWNRRAEATLGISSTESLGRCCYELLSAQTADGQPICGPHCTAMACFRQQQPFGVDVMVSIKPAGARLPCHISTVVLPGRMARGVPKAVVFLALLPTSDSLPMTTAQMLRVYTLGPLRLELGSRPLEWRKWPRKQAVTLLKLLVTRRGHALHREVLSEAMWPEASPEEGWRRLRVVVHALRQYFQAFSADGASPFVATEGECYRLVTGPHLWIDVDRFDELVRQGLQHLKAKEYDAALQAYREAKAMYQGDYLEEDPYHEWFLSERERLREGYHTLLVQMARSYGTLARYDEAISSCREALSLNACRESVHRMLMFCLWAAGRRAEALSQYDVCRGILWRELGVDPLPETTELRQQILRSPHPR